MSEGEALAPAPILSGVNDLKVERMPDKIIIGNVRSNRKKAFEAAASGLGNISYSGDTKKNPIRRATGQKAQCNTESAAVS